MTDTAQNAIVARVHGNVPEDVTEELERIARAHGDLTPELVVAQAEQQGSPLHRYFTWDNNEAARQHRLWQARHLMGRIEVTFYAADGEPVFTGRKFMNVRHEDGSRSYMTAEKTLSDEQYRAQQVEKALAALKHWKARHKHLTEFAHIFAAIDETKITTYAKA